MAGGQGVTGIRHLSAFRGTGRKLSCLDWSNDLSKVLLIGMIIQAMRLFHWASLINGLDGTGYIAGIHEVMDIRLFYNIVS